MNSPFVEVRPQARASFWARLSVRPGLLALGVCLLAGVGLVCWRAQARVNAAYAAAQAQARASAAALELEFAQPVAAGEVLGALARRGGLGPANFQSLAREVFNAHPGLASIELQPGGVVSDVVPRPGNERAIGFNVLKDASQHAGAAEAMARRGLTVSAPVTLYHGEPGLVARVPVFQRGRDGKESFWGFVAASLRLQDALGRAQVTQLGRRGYDYAVSVAGLPRPKVMVAQGLAAPPEAVEERVRVQNLEFRLALKPRGGWLAKGRLAADVVAVGVVSAMVALLVQLLEGRRTVEGDRTEAARQLAREQAERKQAQAEGNALTQKLTTAQAGLRSVELRLQQVQVRADELQAKLDTALRERDEAVRTLQQGQERLGAELEGAQKMNTQLQDRLTAALEAEQQTAAAGKAQSEQQQTALLELRKQLEAATRSAWEAAEGAAGDRVDLEQSNRELQARVQALEGAEARVLELEGRLRESEAEAAKPAGVPVASESSLPAPAPMESPGAEVKSTRMPEREKGTPARVVSVPEEPAVVLAQSSASGVSVPGSAAAPEPQRPGADASAEGKSSVPAEGVKKKERKPKRPDNQMDLFGKQDTKPEPSAKAEVRDQAKGAVAASGPEEPPPARRLPPAPPLDVSVLRTAANQLVPLLTDGDPGARDCLKDNRTAFRSAFSPEGFVDFERLLKGGDFAAALEQLKKALRKHGL